MFEWVSDEQREMEDEFQRACDHYMHEEYMAHIMQEEQDMEA